MIAFRLRSTCYDGQIPGVGAFSGHCKYHVLCLYLIEMERAAWHAKDELEA